jgi:hypothetical protein
MWSASADANRALHAWHPATESEEGRERCSDPALARSKSETPPIALRVIRVPSRTVGNLRTASVYADEPLWHKEDRSIAVSLLREGLAVALSVSVAGGVAFAQSGKSQASNRISPPDATIAYDVTLREFRCWTEATPLPTEVCGEGWHPIDGNLYFIRGQNIRVLLINAYAQDLFSLEIKAEDLAEPTTPVLGGVSELPKMLSLPPAPVVVPNSGVTVTPVAGAPSIKITEGIHRQLSAAIEKDFRGWIQTTFLDPLSAKEVIDLTALDLETALTQLKNTPALYNEVEDRRTAVGTIGKPTTVDQLVARTRSFVRLVEEQAGFRYRLTVNGTAAAGKVVGDGFNALQTTPIARALTIDGVDLRNFTNEVQGTILPPAVRHARIEAIEIRGGAFALKQGYTESGGLNPQADMAGFLDAISLAAEKPIKPDTLPKLKANLIALGELLGSLKASADRRITLGDVDTRLREYRDDAKQPQNVFALQRLLNDLGDKIILKAVELNGTMREIELPLELRQLTVGKWFSTKTVTISLKQGQRVALFDLTGVNESAQASTAGTNAATTKPLQTGVADLTVARVLQIPIYNVYRFQVGFGFAPSTANDERFQVSTVTTGSGNTATTEKFIDQTRSRDYTMLGTVNLLVFAERRHAFPWRPRHSGEKAPRLSSVAAMIGFSLTSPSRDFLLGGAWMPPSSPVGVQIGWHVALRDLPPKGYVPGTVLTDRVVVLKQQRVDGLAVGLVFATDFFGKVFAPIFKP